MKRSPLLTTIPAAVDPYWSCVSTGYENYRPPVELSVSHVETHAAGVDVDRHPIHDGLLFDCRGDADWYMRMVGLTRPYLHPEGT